MSRFSVQSAVMVLMDAGLLLVYWLSPGRDMPTAHIGVLLAKMALMAACSYAFARMNHRPYRRRKLFHRYVDLLFPILYITCESFVFITAPQELEAVVRLAIIPFVAGCVPIISQIKSFCVLFVFHLFLSFWIPQSAYLAFLNRVPVAAFNFWAVDFMTAAFISATIYAWFVNNFNANMDNRRANRELERVNDRLEREKEQRTRLLLAVNDISTNLIGAPAEQFEAELARSMAEIAAAAEVDRVAICKIETRDGALLFTRLHTWPRDIAAENGAQTLIPIPPGWEEALAANQCVGGFGRDGRAVFGGEEILGSTANCVGS